MEDETATPTQWIAATKQDANDAYQYRGLLPGRIALALGAIGSLLIIAATPHDLILEHAGRILLFSAFIPILLAIAVQCIAYTDSPRDLRGISSRRIPVRLLTGPDTPDTKDHTEWPLEWLMITPDVTRTFETPAKDTDGTPMIARLEIEAQAVRIVAFRPAEDGEWDRRHWNAEYKTAGVERIALRNILIVH